MTIRRPILAVLMLAALPLRAAEPAALPEPGPENGGLRMRLLVAPRSDVSKEGFDVRVDLLNTTDRDITLHGKWDHEEAGDVKDYIDAAASIECVPPVLRWMGGVQAGQRKSPQPEHVLKPGAVLSVRWQTEGRRLKNRVTNPNDVQNPEFPFPGLYSVHATLHAITGAGTVALRSNEQLVSVGGSRAMPKSTLGRLLHVDAEAKTAVLSLGALDKVEIGDQFEYLSKRGRAKLTITKVMPSHSVGTLETLFPANAPPLPPGTEVSLILKK
jgi:hypothetical protein